MQKLQEAASEMWHSIGNDNADTSWVFPRSSALNIPCAYGLFAPACPKTFMLDLLPSSWTSRPQYNHVNTRKQKKKNSMESNDICHYWITHPVHEEYFYPVLFALTISTVNSFGTRIGLQKKGSCLVNCKGTTAVEIRMSYKQQIWLRKRLYCLFPQYLHVILRTTGRDLSTDNAWYWTIFYLLKRKDQPYSLNINFV